MSKLLVITNINCKLTEEEFNGTKFFHMIFLKIRLLISKCNFLRTINCSFLIITGTVTPRLFIQIFKPVDTDLQLMLSIILILFNYAGYVYCHGR